MAILELDGGFFHDTDAYCDFCGCYHEECAELVIGPGGAICSECLVECRRRVQSYRDGLPAPERGAMETMAALMRAVAASLNGDPRCPWCHSTDIRRGRCVSHDTNKMVMSNICGNCGASQFGSGVRRRYVTCEEWDHQWFAPPGWYNIGDQPTSKI